MFITCLGVHASVCLRVCAYMFRCIYAYTHGSTYIYIYVYTHLLCLYIVDVCVCANTGVRSYYIGIYMYVYSDMHS